MHDWLLMVGAATLLLFVVLKGVRFAAKKTAPPKRPAQRAPLDGDDVARRAKDLFLRVQRAWDARDMVALSALVTPDALEELQDLAEADADYSVTEILYVSAAIASHTQNEDGATASVLFDVVLRDEAPPQEEGAWDDLLHPSASAGAFAYGAGPEIEGGQGARELAREPAREPGGEPVRVRELWHIVYSAAEGGWRVHAIQQVR
ncbi:MAG: hypothetical protein DELT_01230 [Desulfovibrio sp.]